MQHPDDDAKVTTGSPHPDEGTIHAWLDGQLSAADADALRSHLVNCAECRVAAAEARGLVAASARILRSLDDGPGGVHSNPSASASQASASQASGLLASKSPEAGPGGGAAEAGGQASLAPVAGGTGIRSISDARAVRPGWAKATTHAGRRWRLSAIAAVGLMAVGTTLVLQRNGPLASFTTESSADRVSGASPEALSAPDSQLLAASSGVARETGPATGRALPGSAEALGASAPVGNPTAEKVAPVEEARPEAPPVAVPPRPPEASPAVAAVAAAGGNAEADSARLRSAPAFASPAPSAARAAAPQARTQQGITVAPPLVSAELPVMAVGPVLVGRVTSADGDPVAQALVTVPGTSNAAVTDAAGRFRLAGMSAGEHTATIRHTGFEPARLSFRVGARGDSVVTISLMPAESNLQDVVVTGVAAAPRPPTAAESARRAAASGAKAPSIISPPARPPAVAPSPLSTTSASAPADSAARLATAQRMVGCYRLEVGGAPSASRDSAESALPGWIRLAATPAPDRPGWLEATPLERDQGNPRGSTGWRVTDLDEVEIVWPTVSSAREVILRLLGSGEVLTGTAALRSVDAATAGEREAASIVAVRGVCNY